MNSHNGLNELVATAQTRLLRLRGELQAAEDELYNKLHLSLGLASVDELITVLARYASPDLRRRIEQGPISESNSGPRVREKGARISAEIREKILELLRTGQPAESIASELRVSTPSVYLIKKTAGLTKSRGSRSVKVRLLRKA